MAEDDKVVTLCGCLGWWMYQQLQPLGTWKSYREGIGQPSIK